MHKIVTKWTPYAFKLIIWYWLFFVQNKQKKNPKKVIRQGKGQK